MITVERSFTVPTPLDKVFSYLSDFTTTEQWDPGTVSTTRIDEGPLAVGSRFHNVSKFLGRKTELEYEIAAFAVNSHLIFVGNNKTATATDNITLTAGSEGTAIHYLSTIVFHGLARYLAPLVQRPFNKIADDTISQMREVLSNL